jgi:hypothetical protein
MKLVKVYILDFIIGEVIHVIKLCLDRQFVGSVMAEIDKILKWK